jgi:hypothetical protein
MAKRIGARGEQVMIEPGDNAWQIAVMCVGDGRRWRELLDANPQKPRSEATGNFVSLMPGEVLRLPGAWLTKMGGVPLVPVVAPGAEVGSLHDAGSVRSSPPVPMRAAHDAGALPYGFSDADMQIISGLARMWGASPDDLIVTWFEESGLQPHIYTPLGGTAPDGLPRYEYAGLIEGLGAVYDERPPPLGRGDTRRVFVLDETMGWTKGTWLKIVRDMPIAVQLQAIAQLWDRSFKTNLGGQTLAAYADRMGVSPAAVIHALNFLPAVVRAGLASADAAITKAPSGNYTANKGLDVNGDGKISLRDLDAHGKTKLADLRATRNGAALLAAAGEVSSAPLATLFAPIQSEWRDITGKNPIVTVGWTNAGSMGPGERGAGLVETVAILAALAAAAHYGWPYVQKLLRKG